MSDRIDELVLDGCAFVACPQPQDCDTCPLTQLATVARDNAAEANKLRKVAEWLANQLVTAKVRWPVLVGAWSLPPRAEDVWIEAALAQLVKEATDE